MQLSCVQLVCKRSSMGAGELLRMVSKHNIKWWIFNKAPSEGNANDPFSPNDLIKTAWLSVGTGQLCPKHQRWQWAEIYGKSGGNPCYLKPGKAWTYLAQGLDSIRTACRAAGMSAGPGLWNLIWVLLSLNNSIRVQWGNLMTKRTKPHPQQLLFENCA